MLRTLPPTPDEAPDTKGMVDMRSITLFNESWFFTKNDDATFSQPDVDITGWECVNLPHTWNNLDGQDGGADYYRGRCWYRKALPAFDAGKRVFVEFEAANHIAHVYINGQLVAHHEGGFSTFRAELTPWLTSEKNMLAVSVDNGESHVYPQMADFSFCGGLYRDVHFIQVEPAHFDLGIHGSSGVFVTAVPNEDTAKIRVDAFTVDAQGYHVRCDIVSPEHKIVAQMTGEGRHSVLETSLKEIHKWHGRHDPTMYTARLQLEKDGAIADEVTVYFGIRDYSVDVNTGFRLNGQSYPLHGVSRHQDRFDKGWAISHEDQQQDMELIKEIGANTIRLAHYQHSQYFYSLCDQAGMVIWAEIPFISVFDESEAARQNTLSQMTELVVQNYNHPSICFWGIANEITIGDDNAALQNNLKELHALAKRLDPSRLTTIANVSMLEIDSTHNEITDIIAYNHYFGWYGGTVEQNGPWLDDFHQKRPNCALAISEYGAEGILTWHSENPKVRDYSEEYQAYYHEKMLETFATRPYLWATYVWNMFDFAADARDEGGCKGRNNKGLVTYDRTIRKDSYYIYKAWWSDRPFVHIVGRRYRDRVSETMVKIYTNAKQVTLMVNDQMFAQNQSEKVFVFPNVPLKPGENLLIAKADNGAQDQIILNGVQEPNRDYVLPQVDDAMSDGVENWFSTITPKAKELQFPEGYFSIRDKLGDIMQNEEAKAVLIQVFSVVMGKEMVSSGKGMMKMVMKMMAKKPLEFLFAMAGDRITPTHILIINEALNQVKKARL